MCVLVLGLCAACGDATPATGDVETSGAPLPSDDSSSSGAPACVPGYEGCSCYEGTCLSGLACLSDLCVMLPDPSTSTDGDSGVDTRTTDEPTTTDDGGSSSSDGESSSSESSSTGPIVECEPEQTACADASYQTCIDGSWSDETACNDVCAPNGYDSSGCADELTCACDVPNDDHCNLGAQAYCFCADQYGSPCNDADMTAAYDMCFANTEPAIGCFADHVAGGQIDCDAAINACL